MSDQKIAEREAELERRTQAAEAQCAELTRKVEQQTTLIRELGEALKAFMAQKFGQKQAETAWTLGRAALAKLPKEAQRK